MRQPRILMCPPDYYGIEYEINPWMSRSHGSTPERAHGQWRKLYETLVGHGVTVELMTPQKGLPDLVFTANAGLVFEFGIYPKASISKGPATLSFAGRPCMPGTAFAATWAVINTWARSWAGKFYRWNSSIRASITWILASARWLLGRQSIFQAHSIRMAKRSWRRTSSGYCPHLRTRPIASVATRLLWARRW